MPMGLNFWPSRLPSIEIEPMKLPVTMMFVPANSPEGGTAKNRSTTAWGP